MTHLCDHFENDSSWCNAAKFSTDQFIRFQQSYEQLDGDKQKAYIASCITLTQTNNGHSGYKGKKKYTSQYYLSSACTENLRCCETVFRSVYIVGERALRRIVRCKFEGIPVYKQSGNHTHHRNQYGSPISEKQWKQLEIWIIDNVPRESGHYKGQHVQFIYENGMLLSHDALLS
jgi:hypothetical protein